MFHFLSQYDAVNDKCIPQTWDSGRKKHVFHGAWYFWKSSAKKDDK